MVRLGQDMRRTALIALFALTGCQASRVCTPTGALAAGPPPPDWREAATDPDHVKLRQERTSFLAGLDQARTAGFGAAIDAAGRLYDPDYAEDGAMLAPGHYSCRAVTLGSKAPGRPAYVAEPPRHCSVETAGALRRFVDKDGPQRLTGRIYPDSAAREIFLGTVALKDEATALHYARDADRDRAATIEKIGAQRWRMTIADPAWEAPVEVIEIVPAR